MSRKFRKKAILFAPEATYGVDAIDGGAPVALLGREVKITPMSGENTPLDYDDGTLGNSPELATEIFATVEFSVDWAGSGNAVTPPLYAPLLDACLRKTVVGATEVQLLIDEESSASVTLYFYMDGSLHSLTGARGNFKLEAKAKSFPSLMFNFTGLFAPVTAAAMPTLDLSAWQKPRVVGSAHSAFLLAGQSAKLISLEYDQGNTVTHEEYVGHEEVLIGDYKPSGKLVLEAASLGSFDPFSLATNNSEIALELTHGEAGNQVSWKSNRVQLGRPEYGDQNGTLTYEIPFKPLSNVDELLSR